MQDCLFFKQMHCFLRRTSSGAGRKGLMTRMVSKQVHVGRHCRFQHKRIYKRTQKIWDAGAHLYDSWVRLVQPTLASLIHICFLVFSAPSAQLQRAKQKKKLCLAFGARKTVFFLDRTLHCCFQARTKRDSSYLCPLLSCNITNGCSWLAFNQGELIWHEALLSFNFLFVVSH